MVGHQALVVAPLRQTLRSLNEALGSLRELFDIHIVSFRCPKHTHPDRHLETDARSDLTADMGGPTDRRKTR
jgi:hypothetical protein